MIDAPHRRLLAWRIAGALATEATALVLELPPDLDALGRQIHRAATATVEAIVHGAGTRSDLARVTAFASARGELTELAASLDAFELLGFGPTDDLRERAERVDLLLAGLVARTEAGTIV